MNKQSVFGRGFIGGRFCELFPDDVILRDKGIIGSATPELLWFISTVTNYNVLDNVYIDIDTNLTLTMKALSYGKEMWGDELVFNLISSWFIFGNTDVPARENSICNPNGFYGITAYCREQLVRSYCQTFNICFRIMRLANVLGVGDKKISKRKNALQYFVREIVNNRPVELYWPSHTIRDYIYVDDVCQGINLVLSDGYSKNSIYNIGNGEPIAFEHCVDYVVNKTGNFDCVKHVDQSEFHKVVQTNVMYLDNTNLKRLGYKPTKNIWQILDELIEYYEREKNG